MGSMGHDNKKNTNTFRNLASWKGYLKSTTVSPQFPLARKTGFKCFLNSNLESTCFSSSVKINRFFLEYLSSV